MSLAEPGEREEAVAAKLAFEADVEEEEKERLASKENGCSSPQTNGSGDQQDFDEVRFVSRNVETPVLLLYF